MATQVLIPREQSVWVVGETTEGTSVLPAATDAIAVVGTSSINQESAYTDSEEIANSRSVLAQARDQTGPGEWSLGTYLRADSAAATAPAEGKLWTGLLGTETIGGGSATYSPAIGRDSYTIWWKISNVVIAAFGASVNQLEITSGSTGYTACAWSGQFLELGYCGESTVASAVTAGQTVIPVVDGNQFSRGMFLEIDGDDNGGSGFKISSVSGNNVTISTGLLAGATDTAAVSPYLPAHTLSGEPMEARGGALTIDSGSTTYREFSCTIANGDETITDEVTADEYPSAILGGKREISGTVSVIFRTDDLDHFARGKGSSLYELKFVNTGTAPARVFTLTMPQTRLQVPTVEEATPAMGLSIPYTAIATSSGEDELTAVFAIA